MGSAYEISEFHKREPPPKEILEEVSAKGGDLLNRTIENFQRPVVRDESLVNGTEQQDGSENDAQGTPKDDKIEMEEPGSSASGRVTRGEAGPPSPPHSQLIGVKYCRSSTGASPETALPVRHHSIQAT